MSELSELIEGIQDRASMGRLLEAIAKASDQRLIEFTTEVRRQAMNRAVILRDIGIDQPEGLSATDLLEQQIYPLRLREMSPKELREETIKQYEQLLAGQREAGRKMKELFRIERDT